MFHIEVIWQGELGSGYDIVHFKRLIPAEEIIRAASKEGNRHRDIRHPHLHAVHVDLCLCGDILVQSETPDVGQIRFGSNRVIERNMYIIPSGFKIAYSD